MAKKTFLKQSILWRVFYKHASVCFYFLLDRLIDFNMFFSTRVHRFEISINYLKKLNISFVAKLIFIVIPSLIIFGNLLLSHPSQVHAASTNSNINFQARLEAISGAIVPDGNYNIEVKLYDASSGGTLKWTEDRLNNVSQGVTVTNGYLTVNLGSVNAFPNNINWDQGLWLTLTIGNTNGSCTPFSSCSPDTEMSPRLQITALPYAFRAGKLALLTGANTSVLDWNSQTAARSLYLPDESGTICTNATSGTCSGTGGFVQFASGSIQTDSTANSTIFYNKTNASGNLLQLQRGGSDVFDVGNTGNLTVTEGASSTLGAATNASTTTGYGYTITAGNDSVAASTGGSISVDAGTGVSTNGTISIGTTNASAINIGGSSSLLAASSSVKGVNNSTSGGAGGNLTVQSGTGNTTGTGGTLTLQGGTGGNAAAGGALNINGGTSGGGAAAGGTVTLNGGASNATAGSNGGAVTINGANGSSTGAGGNGGSITITAGNGLGTGPTNGGNITLTAGSATSSGSIGQVLVKNSSNSAVSFQVQNTSAASLLTIDTANNNIILGGNNSATLQPWTSTNSLPNPRTFASYTTANGYIYELGGTAATDSNCSQIPGAANSASNSIYYTKINADGSLGSWTTSSNNLPQALCDASTVTANGYIYVIAGANSSGTDQNTFYYAKLNSDGSIGTWINNSNYYIPATGSGQFVSSGAQDLATAVITNGYIYLYNGESSINNSSGATVFHAKLNSDGSIGSWSYQTMTHGIGEWATGTTANGYIYAFGGWNGGTYYGTGYAKINSDGTVGSWTAGTNLPGASGIVAGSTSFVSNGYVYVLGGENHSASSSTANVYSAPLNSVTGAIGSWSTNTSLSPNPLTFASTVIVNGYVYEIGGFNWGGPTTYSNVYYASTQRIKIGGSLDLVGLGAGDLVSAGNPGQGSIGGSLTAGDGTFVGNLQVQGLANFAQSVGVTSNLSVSGSVAIQTATNTTSAFQVQNASAATILNTDTTINKVTVSGGLNIARTTNPILGSFTATPTTGGGNLNGTYYYVVTYKTGAGETGYSAAISANVVPTNNQVNLTNIPISADLAVTARNIYRSKVGTTTPYYLMTTINNNTATTFTDNVADGSLTTEATNINSTGGQLSVNGNIALKIDDTVLNTSLGAGTLATNFNGHDNTAVGQNALHANTEGNYNVALGSSSLSANLIGVDNTAVGSSTLNSSTGSYNVALGTNALQGNTSGGSNTAIGTFAGVSYVGTNTNTIGSGNTFIGYSAGPGVVSASSLQNATAIGINSAVNQNDSLVLGCISGINNCSTSTSVGIGTATPTATLNVVGTANFKSLAGNSTTAFQIQNNAGAALLIADTQNTLIGVNTTPVNTSAGGFATLQLAGDASLDPAISISGGGEATLGVFYGGTVLTNNSWYANRGGTGWYDINGGLASSIQMQNGGFLVQEGSANASTSITANTVLSTNSALRVGVDATYATMSVPILTTISSSTSGGTGLSATTAYYYKVTSVDGGGGETAVSNEKNVTTGSGATNSNTITWAPITGANGYKIYRCSGSCAGTETLYDYTLGTGNVANTTYSFTITSTNANATVGATYTNNSQTFTVQATIAGATTLVTTGTGAPTASGTLTKASGTGDATLTFSTYVNGATYTDTGAGSGPGSAMPSTNTAYVSKNVTNNNLQLSVGGTGTPTGQVYVSGTVPSSAVASIATDSGSPNAQQVAVNGNYAYVVNSTTNTLKIIDISKPSAPVIVGSMATDTAPTSVVINGYYAYVANNNGVSSTLQTFNISNPTVSCSSSCSIGSVTLPNSVLLDQIAVQGRYVYLVANNLTETIDITNPNKPTIVSSQNNQNAGLSSGISVQNNELYVGGGGLSYFWNNWNITNPASPTGNATPYRVFFKTVGLIVQGRYAYVDNNGTFTVLDASNPSLMTQIGSVTGMGATGYSIAIQGRYAYVADYSSNVIRIVDISVPTNPMLLSSSISLPSSPNSIVVQGRYAYVTLLSGQLQIFDLGGTYSQQLESGGLDTGTLSVNGNSNLAGDANVAGGVTIGSGLQVNGNIGASGNVLLQNTTNSSAAFQVQNAASTDIFTVDTTNSKIGTANQSVNSTNSTNLVIKSGDATGTTSNSGAVTLDSGTATGTSGNLNIGTGAYAHNTTIGNTTGATSLSLKAGSGGATLTTTSSTAFLIQSTTPTTLFTADTSGMVITISGTSSAFASLTLTNAHFKSTQTTAPTIGTPSTCGTTPTAAVQTNSTDSAGSFRITSGTGGQGICSVMLSFNKNYGAAPKSIIVIPETKDGGTGTAAARQIYVSAAATGTFNVTYTSAPAGASEIDWFYYWVVE